MLYPQRATPAHVASISSNLREADRNELWAAGVDNPQAVLEDAARSASGAIAGCDESGEPHLLFGVTPHPHEPMVGFIWAVATVGMLSHRRMFLTHSLQWIEGFHKTFPILTNRTDCRNTEHHRWLQWCGFTIINRVEGPRGLPFYEFVRIRSENV